MRTAPPHSLFLPISRALAQLEDRVFLGIVLRSVILSAVCFAALFAVSVWSIHHLLQLHGWLARLADFAGAAMTSLLALWLFLPVAAGIGTLFFDSIANAVERRFYPWLPAPKGAPFMDQALDGMMVALKVLGLNIAGLILAILIPGFGLLLSWMIASYAFGRGLFVAVAMRRMPRETAESLYRARQGMILLNGAILAASTYIPAMNLFIPVIGTACMVHVLDLALSSAPQADRFGRNFGPVSY